MKKMVLILTLISIKAVAGNGGGTMMTGNKEDLKNTIVYKLGQKDDSLIFKYGKFKDNKWETETMRVPASAVAPEFMEALEQSEMKKAWVQIR